MPIKSMNEDIREIKEDEFEEDFVLEYDFRNEEDEAFDDAKSYDLSNNSTWENIGSVEYDERESDEKNDKKNKMTAATVKTVTIRPTFKDAPTIGQMIQDKIVLRGIVMGTDYDEESKTENMDVRLSDRYFRTETHCIVKREDADNTFRTGTVNYLVGRTVPVVLIRNQNGVLYGSRKEAQDIMYESLQNDFIGHKEFKALILNFTDYGAFVSVKGVVGMLKNTDFSIDHTPVREVYKEGQGIKVIYKYQEGNGRLYFEAVRKYHRPEAVKPDFTEGSIRIGRLVSVREIGMNLYGYIRIRDGIDVMVRFPSEVDELPRVGVEKLVKVQISRITEPEKPYEPYRIYGVFRGNV